MCVKLTPGDLNFDPYPHTPQAFILVKGLVNLEPSGIPRFF